MDIYELLNNKKEVANPNKKSKTDNEPATIQIPNINSNGLSNNIINYEKEEGSYLGNVDLDLYNEYGINASKENINNIAYKLAEKQGMGEKFRRGVEQAVINEILLGIPKGFADLADVTIGSAVRAVTGEENDYTNPIGQIFEDAQEKFREIQPIYTNPDKDIFNGGLTDSGWWASNLPSIFSSAALLIPSTSTAKGVSYLGKIAKLNKVGARNLKFINATTLQKVNTGVELGVNAATGRLIENYQEARQTYDDIYKKAYFGDDTFEGIKDFNETQYEKFCETHKKDLEGIDLNDRRAVAKHIAKVSADTTFKLDLGNVVFDVIELYALKNLFKVKSKSLNGRLKDEYKVSLNSFNNKELIEKNIKSASENKFKTVGKSIFNDTWRNLGFLSEGLEEGVNYIAQEEGLHYGNLILGLEENNSYDDRLGKYFTSPQLYESAFWGVLGGLVFQVGGNQLGRYANHKRSKKLIEEWQKEHPNANKTGETYTPKEFNDSWELDETDERINDIRSRKLKYDKLCGEIEKIKSGVNPFKTNEDGTNVEIQNETEKEALIKQLLENYRIDILLNSMFNGNYKNAIEFLRSEELKQAYIDNGFLTKEEADVNQREILALSNDVEKLYNKHINSVANIIRYHEGDFNDNLMRFAQIITKENIFKEIDANRLNNEINKLTVDINNEIENLNSDNKNLYSNLGINYEDTIEYAILLEKLSQLENDEKQIEYSSSISAQIGLENIKKQKQIILDKLKSKSYIFDIKNNIGVNSQDPIDNLAVQLNILNSKLLQRSKITKNNTEHNIFIASLNKILQTENKFFNINIDSTQQIIKQLSDKNIPLNLDFIKGVNKSFTLNKLFSDENLDKLINVNTGLYNNITKRAILELQKSMMIGDIAMTEDQILKNINDMQMYMMGISENNRAQIIEKGNEVLQSIAKKYKDKFINNIELANVFANGTSNNKTNKQLKSVLSKDDMDLYNDTMFKLSLLNNTKSQKIENNKLETYIKRALWNSARNNFANVNDLQNDNENIETPVEKEDDGEPLNIVLKSTSNKAISDTQNEKSNNLSKNKNEDNREPKKAISERLNYSDMGAKLNNPSCTFILNENGNPIKVDTYKHNGTENVILIPIENKENIYEVDLTSNKDLLDKYGDDSYWFNVVLKLDNGGEILHNPIITLDENGNIKTFEKGEINKREESDNDSQNNAKSANVSSADVVDKANYNEDGTVKAQTFDSYELTEQQQQEQDEEETLNNLKSQIGEEVIKHFKTIKDEINGKRAFSSKKLLNDLKDKFKDIDKNILSEVIENEKDTFSEYIIDIDENNATNDNITTDSTTEERQKVYDNIIKLSNITDSDTNIERNFDTSDINKAFDELLNSYLKHSIKRYKKGKLEISLENLLRYVLDTIPDTTLANSVYDVLKTKIKNSDKYVLLENERTLSNKKDVIDRAFSKELKEINDSEYNGRTIAISSLANKLQQSDFDAYTEIIKTISNLNPNDTVKVHRAGTKIVLSKDVVDFGELFAPTKIGDSNGDRYSMYAMGWNIDYKVDANQPGPNSYAQILFNHLLTDEDFVESIFKENKSAYDIKNIFDYIANSIPEELNGTALERDMLNLKKYDFRNGNLQTAARKRIQLLKTLYNGVIDVYKNDIFDEETKKLIITKSLDNWFKKRKNSYDATYTLMNDRSINTIKIDTIYEGNLIINSGENKLSINDENAMSKETRDSAELVIVSDNQLISTRENRDNKFNYKNNSTFVSILRKNGMHEQIQAFPKTLNQLNDKNSDIYKIKTDIKNHLKDLIIRWGNSPTMPATTIANFINSLNNSGLFKGIKVSQLTDNFEGYSLTYKANDGYHNIVLFDKNAYGYASVVKFEQEKATTISTTGNLNKQQEFIDKLMQFVDNGLSINISKDIISNIYKDRSICKLNDNREFEITIPNGDTYKYKSYKDFMFNNGLIQINSKINPITGRNFNIESVLNESITFKFNEEEKTPVEENDDKIITIETNKDILTLEEAKSILASKDKDKIKQLVYKLLNKSQLRILKNSKIIDKILDNEIVYDEVLRIKDKNGITTDSNAIAAYNPSSKSVYPKDSIIVTDKWLYLLNDDNETNKYTRIKHREEAFRHLLHECVHKQINSLDKQQKEVLFSEIRTIFKQFVEQNKKDNVSEKYSNYTYDKTETVKKEYYTDGELNNDGIEEFIVESITRPILIERLNEIPINDKLSDKSIKNVRNNNIFQRVLQLISKLFNLDINESSLLGKEYKLFNSIFENKKETNNVEKTNNIAENNNIVENDNIEENKKNTINNTEENTSNKELQFIDDSMFGEDDDSNVANTTTEKIDVNNMRFSTTLDSDVTINDINKINNDSAKEEQDNGTYNVEISSLETLKNSIDEDKRKKFNKFVGKGIFNYHC